MRDRRGRTRGAGSRGWPAADGRRRSSATARARSPAAAGRWRRRGDRTSARSGRVRPEQGHGARRIESASARVSHCESMRSGMSYARACTRSATACSHICSRTAAGAGATPGSSSTARARCSSTRCSTSRLTEQMLTRDAPRGAGGGAHRHARQHARQRRSLLRQPARRRRAHHRLRAHRRGDDRAAARGDGGAARAGAGDGRAGAFFLRCFGAFDFKGIELALPEETFSGELHARGGRSRAAS